MAMNKKEFLEYLNVTIATYNTDLAVIEHTVDQIIATENYSPYERSQLEWELTHAMHNYQELMRDLRRLTKTLEGTKLNAG